MSIARHHAEWLSLVPVSGPFLSLPVLLEAFNAGLEPHDPDHSRLLRQEYENWLEAMEKRRGDPAPHQQWIRFVLGGTLELDDRMLVEGQAIPQTLQVEVPEHHELLRPSLVVADPGTKTPRMLVKAYPRSQELASYVAGLPWKASPETRMAELLRGTGVRLGLVTNGEHWMLVDVPKEGATGYASWYANLWLDEPITLRAFRSLLGSDRFFNVEGDRTLEALLKKSASNQQEVTEQLGYQVRRAVEVLIHSLDKADQDFGRELLAGVKEGVLYESALTVMMRLVFLFCAEERELIPSKPFPVYEQNYSVSMISKQLRELADQHGEELLERRFDAWTRLLAAFRAVFGGLEHDDAHIPAYGGSLFNPDRFPFLEGRRAGTNWREDEAKPLPVNNRTVLHLLEALQLLQIRVPGGGRAEARRISFRALDIEQIGHVYEGLLDHTARRATEPHLGLAGTREKEPEIPLAELERLTAKGEADLVKFLKDVTGRSEPALKKGLKAEIDDLLARLFRTACQGDEALWGRVRPFAGLVRLDNFGYPVVIPQRSIFVTAGTDRRSSGTHYTPRELTEPIVKYTLEPLVYVGPAEGLPKDQWTLKSAKELLDLKICDMACGSGALLVQAARYLAERLLEAWNKAKEVNPSAPGITPEGELSGGLVTEELIPDEPVERETYAMRIIARRCLYGVDKNPLAVEMAKLSLWLLTMEKDRPFSFLDHAIRPGDSLVGVNARQLETFSLDGKGEGMTRAGGEVVYYNTFLNMIPKIMEITRQQRLRLEKIPDNDIRAAQEKQELFGHIRKNTKRLNYAADRLLAASWTPAKAAERTALLKAALREVDDRIRDVDPDLLEAEGRAAREAVGCPQTFHWALEFPEVFLDRGGFDAFVGNPPFLGGIRIRGTLGEDYLRFLQAYWGGGNRADLCAYFFRRAMSLAHRSGMMGLLATNTIAQGDTREFGLDRLVQDGASIVRAIASRAWPGAASLEVSHVWLSLRPYKGQKYLDDHPTSGVTTYLTPKAEVAGTPCRLAANAGKSFKGSDPLGIGFIIDEREANDLIERNPKNAEVVQPYLNGEDLNSRPDQSASRWTIHFRDWPLDHDSAPEGYAGPVAADYPDCLAILEERVKPTRQRTKLDGGYVLRTPLPQKWWIYNCPRPELYRTIRGMERVLVRPEVSNTHAMVFVRTGIVFSNKLCVFGLDEPGRFSALQSNLHEAWARFYGSTMRTDMSYTTADCFDPFPLPDCTQDSSGIGSAYHDYRRQIMLSRQEGLTKIYNYFHNSDEPAADIQRLRDLHVEMDRAVAAAYGWTDLDLDHGFHETKQGLRFTISEPARREVLARLLKLNHERYAEEVKQGLHEPKSKRRAADEQKTKRTRKQKTAPPVDRTLFDFPVTDRDKQLCGLLSDLVVARPSLRATAYLDALVIAERPERYGVLLLDEDRSQFLTITKRLGAAHPRTSEVLPWADMLQLLTLQGTLHQGAGTTLEPGDHFDERRGAFPSCDPLIIQLIHKAAETLRELQGSARGVASDDDEILLEFDRDKRALSGAIP